MNKVIEINGKPYTFTYGHERTVEESKQASPGDVRVYYSSNNGTLSYQVKTYTGINPHYLSYGNHTSFLVRYLAKGSNVTICLNAIEKNITSEEQTMVEEYIKDDIEGIDRFGMIDLGKISEKLAENGQLGFGSRTNPIEHEYYRCLLGKSSNFNELLKYIKELNKTIEASRGQKYEPGKYSEMYNRMQYLLRCLNSGETNILEIFKPFVVELVYNPGWQTPCRLAFPSLQAPIDQGGF